MSRCALLLVAPLALLVACSRTPLVGTGVTPVAVIDPARAEVERGQRLTLSGRDSFDPAGAPLGFSWRLVGRPGGASARLESTTAAEASFTPDAEGAWELELVVSAAERRSLPVSAIVSVRPPAPAGDAGRADDAGPGDAGGAVDAGGPDAGRGDDAGLPDGGPRDSGLGLDGGLRVLDPGEVYLAGTLSEGACYRDALAHWANPNVAAVSFDCYFDERRAVVRPTDGTLLYTNTFDDRLREFHCDACPYTGTYPAWSASPDDVIATPCEATTARLASFLVSADGEVLHACSDTPGLWRDATGGVIYDGTVTPPVAAGVGRWLLTRAHLVQPDGGTVTLSGLPAAGGPTPALLTARWDMAGGFLVALATTPEPSLWRVDLSGLATKVGDYPPVPTGFSATALLSKLDRNGRLFSLGRDTSASFVDVIVRREVGGAADVVYTERTNPLVKVHISGLVTGP